jgi:hypothetical protein
VIAPPIRQLLPCSATSFLCDQPRPRDRYALALGKDAFKDVLRGTNVLVSKNGDKILGIELNGKKPK